MKRELERFERWMLSELERPFDARRLPRARRARIESEVSPSSTLSGPERLALYADLVRTRLVRCLRQDFPATERALGARRFEALAGAFVERHPPRHYSLNQLGAGFARFLVRRRAPRSVSDLAELERAVQDVFDAPREEPLSDAELLALPQKSWGRLKLRPVAAARLIPSDFDVDRYLQAVLERRPLPRRQRRKGVTLVWRRGFAVYRRELPTDEAQLLAAMFAGQPLGRALATLPARARPKLAGWCRSWASEGLFRSLGRGH